MIHFVVAEDGHILHRTADALFWNLQYRDLKPSIGPFIIPDRTNVYLPYYMVHDTVRTKRDIALLTHFEYTNEHKAEKFRTVVRDERMVLWAMSRSVARNARIEGGLRDYPPVFEIPCHPQFRQAKKLKLLVPVVPSKRKGLEVLDKLRDIPGVEIMMTRGEVPFEELLLWYNDCSYVLVTGRIEGGPMAVKEAIAMGKPVIAPDVGWCWDHPVVRYQDDDELVRIVTKLAPAQTDPYREIADWLVGLDQE